MEPFFPIGVDYGGTLPREEWRNDIRQIDEAGFNCIRVFVGERTPNELDYILDLAEDRGLKVLVEFSYWYLREEIGISTKDEAFMPAVVDYCRSIVARLHLRQCVHSWIVDMLWPYDGVVGESLIQAITEADPDRLVAKDWVYSGVKSPGVSVVYSRMSSALSNPAESLRREEMAIGFMVRHSATRGKADIWASHLTGGVLWLTDYEPRDISQVTWATLGHGAKGLLYGHWDPSSNFPAIAHLKSIEYSLWNVLKRISSDISRIQSQPGILRATPLRPNVAVLTSKNDGRLAVYRLLADNLVSVGFIGEDATLDELRVFSAIYVPMLKHCPRELADKLNEYVHSGGSLIAQAMTAVMDDEDKLNPLVPGLGLDEVFGCRWRGNPAELLSPVTKEPKRQSRPVATTSIAQGVFTTVGANSRFYLEGPTVDLDVDPGKSAILDFLDPRTLNPIGPAAVVGKYGAGKTVFIAGNLSKTYYDTENHHARELMSGVLDWLEVPRQVEMEGLTKGFENRFEVTVMEGLDDENRRAVICLNHSHATHHPTFTLPLRAPSVIRELLTGETIEARISNDQISFDTHVPEREVRVYYESTT